MAEQRIVIGFTGLEFTTGMDTATCGKLAFRVKDHPNNADIHARLLGMMTKRQIVISLDGGTLTVALQEKE